MAFEINGGPIARMKLSEDDRECLVIASPGRIEIVLTKRAPGSHVSIETVFDGAPFFMLSEIINTANQ